jgi:uncharacterized membrane protein
MPTHRDERVAEMRARSDAVLNGALIAVGALGILDNIVVHWLLQLHRAVPGPHALEVELSLLALSAGLFILGVWRELRARRHESTRSSKSRNTTH